MALPQRRRRTLNAALAAGVAALALCLAPALAQEADRDTSESQGLRDGLRGAVAPQLRPLAERDSALAAARKGGTAPPLPATYSAGTGDAAPGAAINYGKARKPLRLPKAYPPLRTGKAPLPQLEPYRNSYAARRQAREQARQRPLDDREAQQPPPTGVAVVPTIAVKTRKKAEENPFEPVGVDVGSLRLRPYVEGGFGYDTKNIVDLMRYLIPMPVPQRWRRRMIAFGSGDPTKIICSALIAQASRPARSPRRACRARETRQ